MAKSSEPVVLDLAPVSREQMGPFLMLGLALLSSFGLLLPLLSAAWLARGELLRLAPLPFLPVAAHDQYAAALRLAGRNSSVRWVRRLKPFTPRP